jgi:hypothetical protein
MPIPGAKRAWPSREGAQMTDLRNLTIIGLLGRLNTLLDDGVAVPSPEEVKRCIASRTILELLRGRYGDFPEFAPIHKAEAILMEQELKAMMEKYSDREEQKMGVSKNGLCVLVGYGLEILMERNIKEVVG